MHPIERLRYVARAQEAGPELLVREAAAALAGFGSDPAALVTACRRLLDRHLTCGALWVLAARVLTSAEPVAEAWRVADEVEADATARRLSADLPDDATVVVVGWPAAGEEAVRRRGDLEVLVVSSAGEGSGLCRRLRGVGVDALDVPDAGAGAAAAEADLVLLEAGALGPGGLLAPVGSLAVAAVARHTGVPVWAVAGANRVLPARLWDALLARVDGAAGDPWERPDDLLPLDLVDVVYRPGATLAPPQAAAAADCPAAGELLRAVG